MANLKEEKINGITYTFTRNGDYLFAQSSAFKGNIPMGSITKEQAIKNIKQYAFYTSKVKYEVKNVIRNIGHDMQGFKADVYRDGSKLGTVQDDGWGGQVLEEDWLNPEYGRLFHQDMEMMKFVEMNKGQNSKYYYGGYLMFDEYMFIERLVNKR